MKFLCDVHISYKIVKQLKYLGFETVHVNEILDKSATKDSEISNFADVNNYVVVTKDSDFRDSFLVKQTPQKLIKINLGNISNRKLQNIFSENIFSISKLDNKNCFMVEIDTESINYIVL
ncbi:MAG: DUF5615 family PIN-like protein [Prolixibacteraceae bacterium]|nr:DUF5615 family PIN-like protein [Prolixibacteraceae bacterium]